MNNDTIAAISTAAGEAGISIVRISGPQSLLIADALFVSHGAPPSKRPDRSLLHGTIASENEILDEVILLIMRAPHSYTREDIVEIQAHGGTASARRVLRGVLAHGARMAEAGEFTRRAFLNGRIDLVQAESVLDIIRAQSDRAAQSALEQLDGRLSQKFCRIYDEIVSVVSDLEATLDFGEGELLPDVLHRTLQQLDAVKTTIKRMLATWEEGHILREGALVVISGKPNTGKSTLLNTLLEKDRAIVSPTPGTTRDTIEETMILSGYPLRLVDTAGLRAPKCDIEKNGLERALKHVESADIRIHLCDCSKSLDAEDHAAFQQMNPQRTIIALNKSDLSPPTFPHHCQPLTALSISSKTGRGLEYLKTTLLQKLGLVAGPDAHVAISERHRDILNIAIENLDEAAELLHSKGEEFIAVASSSLRCAAENVGRIIGKTYSDDMLDAIFSRFCIGK